MSNLSLKKKQRRLDYLVRKNVIFFSPFKKFNLKEDLESLISFKSKSPQLKERCELFELFIELGYTDKEAYKYWAEKYHVQKQISNQYRKKPILKKQDNKDYINFGSGNSNGNKIRYPKKVRKTAWKRFYKLFPKLKPVE